MTRKEAIERFENVKASALVQKASGVSEYWQNEIDGTIEAIDLAIESLSADPTSKSTVTINSPISFTFDVVSVVRCKDCKYWQDNQEGHYPNELCPWDKGETPDEDDYCSFAERKEE